MFAKNDSCKTVFWHLIIEANNFTTTFQNYYQPSFPVSTTDGEYMNLTGLIPKEGVWSFYKSSKISMPLGFGTKFKNEGYISYAFHDHNYKYYDRHLSHPNLGFTYLACGNGLQKKMNCSHWPNSDKEMIDATTSYYLNKEWEHTPKIIVNICGVDHTVAKGGIHAARRRDGTRRLSQPVYAKRHGKADKRRIRPHVPAFRRGWTEKDSVCVRTARGRKAGAGKRRLDERFRDV